MAINNLLEIDGKAYDVVVISIKEGSTILYSDNTGRTMSKGARMTLDPLGTFYNHTVIVKRNKDNFKEYDELFDYITNPVYNGFHVKVVHNQTTIEYDAYISSVEREVQYADIKNEKVYWKEMSISMIAMEAQRIPV